MLRMLPRLLLAAALLLGACGPSSGTGSDGAENVSQAPGDQANRAALFPVKVERVDCGAEEGDRQCFLVRVENIGAVAGGGSCELFWTDDDDNIVGEVTAFNIPRLEAGDSVKRLVGIQPSSDEALEASAGCRPGPIQ
jgi:hypothetical protein